MPEPRLALPTQKPAGMIWLPQKAALWPNLAAAGRSLNICMLSVHTCPLAALGGKETGGMNVYVRDLSLKLTRRGHQVDIFTRSPDPCAPRVSHELSSGARVIHIPAGPEKPANKQKVRDHLPEFVAQVREFAKRAGRRYDVIHSHYWLSGLAARELSEGWGGRPIVQMFHTLGHMKNRRGHHQTAQGRWAALAAQRQQPGIGPAIRLARHRSPDHWPFRRSDLRPAARCRAGSRGRGRLIALPSHRAYGMM